MSKFTLIFVFIALSALSLTFAAKPPPVDECGDNEIIFKDCVSSSRNDCECTAAIKRDCRIGCMCKDGYCRKDRTSPCVPRTCQHPVYRAH